MEEKFIQISPARKGLAEAKRNAWFVIAEESQKPEDLLNPAVWAHHCRDLRPWDLIEVVADDGTWFAEYRVLTVERTWARVAIVTKVNLTTQDVSQTEAQKFDSAGFEIKRRGEHAKWCVIRKKDSSVVYEKGNTQGEAAAWLREHIKVTA